MPRLMFLVFLYLSIVSPLTGTTILWNETDHRLNTNPSQGSVTRSPQVVASGNNVYAVWEDKHNGLEDICFNRSSDRGVTWEPTEIRINWSPPGSSQCNDPQIATSGSRVYVVWSEIRPHAIRPDVFLNYSTDSGATWQPSDIRVNNHSFYNHSASYPLIRVSGNNVWVAWKDSRHSGGILAQLYMNHSTNGGQTWQSSDTQVCMGTGLEIRKVQIEADPPNVYVLWSQTRTEGEGVFLNWSTNNGITFHQADTKVNHNTTNGTVYTPNLAVQGDVLNVVWRYSYRQDRFIMANRSTDGGLSWQGDDTELVADAIAPDLASSPSLLGLVYGQNQKLLSISSTDQGLTWSDQPSVVRPQNVHYFRSWHIGTNGNDVVVIWEEPEEPNEVFCNGSSDGGDTFGVFPTVVNISPESNAARPRIAFNEDSSRVYAVWEQDLMVYFRAGALALFADGFDLGGAYEWSAYVSAP